MTRVYLIAFYTIVMKEVRRFMRIWGQTLLPPAMTMILYFMIFGKLIGARVGEVGGVSYILFIVPGLIMMAVINNAYSNTSSSFYGAKFQRNVDEMLVAPIPNSLIILGYAIGGMLRGVVVGIVVLVIAFFFTELSFYHPLLMILVVVLSAALFALAGLTNGLLANSMDDVNLIPMFILTPLSYLGGVFYSLDMLPEAFKTISYFNPIVYLVNAVRYCMLGVADIEIGYSVIVIAFMVIILFLLNVYLLKYSTKTRS